MKNPHNPNTVSVEPLNIFDIVLSIYNQEKIIEKILGGIFKNTTTPFNLILVFDGCTDTTMPRALDYIKKINPPLLRDLRTTTAPNVYETKANNIGFKMGTEKYLITIQDDMLIEEKGWEIRLSYPIRKYKDIFSVTARTALNIYFEENSENPIYTDKAGREFLSLKRSQFAIRSGINRGPVAFRTDILKQLNYLDEAFAPAQWDEFDLVLRAHELYGMKSGVFEIDYRSDIAWGKTRQSETTMNTNSTYKKNVLLLRKKHPQLSVREKNIIEDRYISRSEIDYVAKDAFFSRLFRRSRADLRYFSWFIRRKYVFLKHDIKTFLKKFLAKRVSERTIYIVSTVPTGGKIRRVINRIIQKTGMTPLHRLGMDFLIPWTTPLRSPHASSRNMLHHLKKFGRVRYYSLYEKGVIHLKPQDVFIGQPVAEGGFSMDTRPDRDDPQSITSQTLRANKDNHNKFLIVPFANDALLMSWVKDLALHHADKVILIGGEIWTKDWTHNVFSEIDRKKILRIDNAVDSKEYYPIKKEFNPPGKRKFLYIGHTGWYKNTQELEHIAARMDTFEGGHIGGGAVKGWKQIDAFADFNAEFLKNLAKEYDIFVTVSTADAQATTIIENMCFGFPIACTPETGYEYPSIVKLDTKDTVANIRALTAMQNMPEAELRRLVEENYKVVERYHSWKTYVTAISNFMNL